MPCPVVGYEGGLHLLTRGSVGTQCQVGDSVQGMRTECYLWRLIDRYRRGLGLRSMGRGLDARVRGLRSRAGDSTAEPRAGKGRQERAQCGWVGER